MSPSPVARLPHTPPSRPTQDLVEEDFLDLKTDELLGSMRRMLRTRNFRDRATRHPLMMCLIPTALMMCLIPTALVMCLIPTAHSATR